MYYGVSNLETTQSRNLFSWGDLTRVIHVFLTKLVFFYSFWFYCIIYIYIYIYIYIVTKQFFTAKKVSETQFLCGMNFTWKTFCYEKRVGLRFLLMRLR